MCLSISQMPLGDPLARQNTAQLHDILWELSSALAVVGGQLTAL